MARRYRLDSVAALRLLRRHQAAQRQQRQQAVQRPGARRVAGNKPVQTRADHDMSSYWLENGMHPTHDRHKLVDCGYVTDQKARDRADRLMKHVSRSNVQIVGGPMRIVVRLPPTQIAAVMKVLPIKEGGAEYCWCTHSWK
jgi:hypothetical protein